MSTHRLPQVLLTLFSITTITATVDIVLLFFPRGLPRAHFRMTIDSAHSALAETVVQPLCNSCIENFRRARPSTAKPHGSIRFRVRFRDILFWGSCYDSRLRRYLEDHVGDDHVGDQTRRAQDEKRSFSWPDNSTPHDILAAARDED
jgi:hypothetical protein